MQTRRSHRKSRTGCTECKRRRIKCDELYPSCLNCQRRKQRCSLAISRASTADIEPVRPSRTSDSEDPSRSAWPSFPALINIEFPLTPPALPAIWYGGVELMHHYSTVTAETLAIRPDMQNVWRTIVPEMGYQSPFVLHGILAVAAQHKAHLLPGVRDKYLDMAAYHQAIGLKGFRAALPNVNDNNWKPFFCFSSIIVIYVCSLLGQVDERGTDTVPDILKLFVMIRGLRATLPIRDSQLAGTELAPWSHGVWILDEQDASLYEQDPSPNHSRLPQDVFDALRRLSGFFSTHLPESSRQDYEDAVILLRKAATLIVHAGTRVEIGMVMFFPYVIHENIISDIQAANPYAMLLLSYFALLLKSMEDQFWFIRGWPARLWEAADERSKFHPKLKTMLRWPKEQALKLYTY
ncbi:hypothetical protein F9C07_2281632 [Aspergillus flavus]|uniref:Zn(2)-C6 fungal-type domain-containing protein n=2 Tax=Aspergillus subgen. Circumdati TaxID=2720871 RepID=A0A7U2MKU0_ASPFN|nr:uncharacterized protein G4B84_004563 [Aspergillus flavus NRRL3357]KAF7617854.1 hypothetical protein AFLA_006764 [Aspergillus flavus NRRL3357]OOO14018.1 Protein of unknown function DUF3468 [Aspergillus oryzae]QMW29228.1 hypothetical protein G4B84_004563 [Aspergillus flavus NRRL3357]QRD85533.1 hypothetical protein F9C07_2281632 [Aspergillus flavus]